jgi:hypothetical protein
VEISAVAVRGGYRVTPQRRASAYCFGIRWPKEALAMWTRTFVVIGLFALCGGAASAADPCELSVPPDPTGDFQRLLTCALPGVRDIDARNRFPTLHLGEPDTAGNAAFGKIATLANDRDLLRKLDADWRLLSLRVIGGLN